MINFKRSRVFFAEDTGGEGAPLAPTEPNTPPSESVETSKEPVVESQTEPETKPQIQTEEKMPAWTSQVSPTLRNDQWFKEFFKDSKSITDAVTKARDMVGETDKLKKNLEGSIKIPTAESTSEEIKDFMQKLGVPESVDGYKFYKEEDLCDNGKDLVKEFKTRAFKAGMTEKQAQAGWTFILSMSRASTNIIERSKNELAQSFDKRLTEMEGKMSGLQGSELEGRSKETGNLFARFLQESGLTNIIKDSPIIYNVEFVSKVADYMRKTHPGALKDQTTVVGKQRSKGLVHSAEWESFANND